MIAFVIIFSIIATGCIQDTTEIDGTIYNRTDETVKLIFEATVSPDTGEIGSPQQDWVWVLNNSSKSKTLHVGTWTITARYDINNEYIDATDLVIQASDSEFTIIVYNDTIYAEAH